MLTKKSLMHKKAIHSRGWGSEAHTCLYDDQISGALCLFQHRRANRTGVLLAKVDLEKHAHHQAVGNLASMLRATAWTKDGIVEALELTIEDAKNSPFLLGVQFHPERLYEKYPEYLKVFKAFTRACSQDSG